jgi:hypothetical protein
MPQEAVVVERDAVAVMFKRVADDPRRHDGVDLLLPVV